MWSSEPLAKGRTMKMDNPKTLSISRPDVGMWETYTVCPEYADGLSPAPGGDHGQYKVEFVLGVSTFQIENVRVSFEAQGDSFIQFRNPKTNHPDEVVEVRIQARGPNGEQGLARIVCNAQGRMSKVIFDDLIADNRFSAEKIAYLLIAPILSWISYAYDVPVQIVQINTIELSTSVYATTTWMSPKIKGMDTKFEIPAIPHNPRLLECIGQYREGITTTNEFYSFLCFWKAFEGAEHIRTKLDQYIHRGSITGLPQRQLNIPGVPDVIDRFPNFVGKRIGYVREQFRKVRRDAIAHLDISSGTFASAHSLEELNEIRRALPVMRLVAKSAISNELTIYKALIERGFTKLPI